jgi:uncharacterized membrane protein YfcA
MPPCVSFTTLRKTQTNVPDTLTTSLLLFLVGLVAGTINVIAGGGSLLTLPVMIFMGLPPTVANGTNRLGILVESLSATWSFHRRGLISREWLLLALPAAMAGAVIGTIAAVNIGDLVFQRILAVIMVASAAWTIWHHKEPFVAKDGDVPTGARRYFFVAVFFLIGVYGGFIQAGVGFVILAATSLAGLNLIRGNALKVTVVLAFTPLALALFAWGGKVNWAMGTALAAGMFLGGLAGVHLQVLKGHKWVRNVVTVVIVIFAIRLLFST